MTVIIPIILLLCFVRTNSSEERESLQSLDTLIYREIFDPRSRNERFAVALIDELGLANRLRILFSLYLVAVDTNRTLLVIWIPSEVSN